MSGQAIQVTGVKRFVRQLRELDANMVKTMREVALAAAATIAEDARSRAPRVSGALAASIRPGATAHAAVVRAGGKAVPYAGAIHFGWPAHSIAPQPFMYQALDARRAEVAAAFEVGVTKLVHEAFPPGADL